MNTLKAFGLYVFLLASLIGFLASSCQTSKCIQKDSCCTKKASVDKCTTGSKKAESCKH